MQIDRKTLDSLLSLNDRQLGAIINRLVSESGINPADFNINPTDIASIRSAITNASEADLQNIVSQYETAMQAKNTRGGKR